MATSKINQPGQSNLMETTTHVSGNSTNSITLPSAYTEAIILIFRAAAGGGLYVIDQWGAVCNIVGMQNVTVSKETTSNVVTIVNNTVASVRVKYIVRV